MLLPHGLSISKAAGAPAAGSALYIWGSNFYGILGNETAASNLTPGAIGDSDWATDNQYRNAAGNGTLAIKTDGTLWAWGANNIGQLGLGDTVDRFSPTQVGALSDWAKVSLDSGQNAASAVKTDGTLWAWGNNGFSSLGLGDQINRSSPTQVGSLSNWAQTSNGNYYVLAVKTDGSLWGWGRNTDGQLGIGITTFYQSSPTQIGSLSDWAQVSAGYSHSLAAKTDGTLWAWGENENGELGLGDTTKRSSPTQVGSLSDWARVSAGNRYSLAVKTDGTLWAWGSNDRGQLGHGDTTNYSSPVQIGALSNWSQVSAVEFCAFALKTDGTLWSWGDPDGSIGALGTGTADPYSSPVQIGSGFDVLFYSSAANLNPNIAGTSGNELYLWGSNKTVPLAASSPVQVGTEARWASATIGDSYCVAIDASNALWSWGVNAAGQLGLGSTTSYSSPVQVGALSDWAQVSSGLNHILAIKTDGTLWAWGVNAAGQLGLGSTTSYSSPVQVGALSDWAQLGTGGSSSTGGFTVAVKTNGTLWSWGDNNLGKLGLGDTVDRSSPVQVGSLSDWAQVSLGSNHVLALKTDGTLWSWGSGSFGRTGLGDTVSRSSPVQVGSLSDWAQVSAGFIQSLAVKTDGTLWAWGYNTYGELGLGDTVARSSPVQVGSLSDWAQVASDYYSTIAVKTDGTLWAWGRGTNGQLGLGDTANYSSPVQVGALTTWLGGVQKRGQYNSGALST